MTDEIELNETDLSTDASTVVSTDEVEAEPQAIQRRKKKPLSEAKKRALLKANEARKRKALERKNAKKEALARQYLDEMADKIVNEEKSVSARHSKRYAHYASESEESSDEEVIVKKKRKKRKPPPKKKKKKVVYISESESESESEDETPPPQRYKQPTRTQPEPYKINFF